MAITMKEAENYHMRDFYLEILQYHLKPFPINISPVMR